jgi:hypothetical protein
MEVVGEVYIHEMEVLHDSCRESSKILPRVCWSMHVSDHVTNPNVNLERIEIPFEAPIERVYVIL